jgi:DNA (cytosine-5)-methyltransferase 1
MKLKVLDLFSGIGGFSLGLERTGHFETVAFCEIDEYCKLILKKHWKGIKIYDDVKEITKERLEADGIQIPDVITGGFPCQSFSVAGKQKGTSDSRYLWPEMFRIIKIFKSKFVIGENVRGIVNIENGMVFETVCTDLESEGYEVQPFLIPAAGVGAPHRRDRIWFIAHLANATSKGTRENDEGVWSRTSGVSGRQETTLANAITGNVEAGRQRHGTLRTGHQEERLSDHVASGGETQGQSTWWNVEPDVGRVAHGVSGRIHRLKGLGNAIVPQIAEEIGRAIIKAES